jgi:hypothetical protein
MELEMVAGSMPNSVRAPGFMKVNDVKFLSQSRVDEKCRRLAAPA